MSDYYNQYYDEMGIQEQEQLYDSIVLRGPVNGNATGGLVADITSNPWAMLAVGFAVGAVATLVMVNMTGEKSIIGLSKKTASGIKKGYSVTKGTVGW